MNPRLTDKFVTFICTGNTCRSPMAECLFLHAIKAENEPLKSLKATSAGISAFEGTPPSPYAIKALKDCGIPLDGHRSQQLTQQIINNSFILFCMTHVHKEIIQSDYHLDSCPIYLLREFLPNLKNKDISDPFGQSLSAYQACRDNMVEAIPSIILFLKHKFLNLK